MAIDKTGKWWKGSEAGDIQRYLAACSADSYPIETYRAVQCQCGGSDFELHFDGNEGVARRTCPACKKVVHLGDSAEHWADARPKKWKCIECKTNRTNLGVGFALRADREIRWIFVGCRCANCGVLGCPAQWKIDYAPTKQLLDMI